MIIANKKTNDTNNRQKCDKDSAKRKVVISINQVISIANQIFVISFLGVFAIWTKPFMTDYYQKLANSHYDSVQWFQMGTVFLVALFFAIHSFVNKRFFVGILTIIIAIWSFYWAFLAGPFYCQLCTYGG
ncbi:MAG: hypothetical protein IJN54_12495 [Lachnospiraceae bacterium]|nr:hypothetical protein [Lachnospiraceae bacterium]